MPDLHSAIRGRLPIFYRWLFNFFGREWIEYFVSNSMNLGLQRVNQFLWNYDCKALILDIVQETPTTKTFLLLPNQHFTAAIPGQHTEVSITLDNGDVVKRCYTLSKVSEETVAITVKHQPNGKVSNWLHQHAKIGMQLAISSPRGRFVYEGQDKLIFICAGSGITPCFAMINQFHGIASSPHISLYYRSKSAAETIFKESLETHPHIDQLVLSFSQQMQPENESDFPVSLAKLFPELLQSSIYLCGPAKFRNRVIQYLENADYDMNGLYLESFAPIKGTTNQSSKTWQGDVVVHLSSQNQSFLMTAADYGKTLLETAEANGIKMVHGCRSGMCGTCKTKIISGDIVGAKLGNAIYPCVSYPASPEIVLQ